MSRFPPEIYGQIAADLSQHDLWSLSLVSSSTVDESNRVLYRDIDFSSLPVNVFARDSSLKRKQDKPLNSFFRTVSNSPRLASLVNSLAFRTPYQPELDVDPSLAFGSLINICSLSITSILFSDQLPSFLNACTPNLKVLHATFPLNLSFLTFVKATPNIRLLSFGRDKTPAAIDIDPWISENAPSLQSLTSLSVVEGAIRLVPYCSALSHLDVRMSERQGVSLVLDTLKTIGPQLITLTWHQALFYGNEAIVQCMQSLADLTPSLESLNVGVRFCGGWGNPPCVQYATDIESLNLSGSWSKLESIIWKSHLSCHDHLVYWEGTTLCNHAFAVLPSLRSVNYTEECRVESDFYVALSYERNDYGRLEMKEVGSVNGKRYQSA